METNHSPEPHLDLDDQLQAARAGGIGGERLARTADIAGGRYAATTATLVALYLLVVVYIYPQDIVWLNIAATAAFTAGMAGTCRSYGRRRRASGLGWSRRHSAGFALTALLFGLGVALQGMTDVRDACLWIPYAAATGLPLMAGVSDALCGGFRASSGRKTA